MVSLAALQKMPSIVPVLGLLNIHQPNISIMHQGVCQRLAAVMVNERLNVPRADFDRLKATLTNGIRLGPHQPVAGEIHHAPPIPSLGKAPGTNHTSQNGIGAGASQ